LKACKLGPKIFSKQKSLIVAFSWTHAVNVKTLKLHRLSKLEVKNMPKVLTRGEWADWAISHLFFVLGLISVSYAIWFYAPGIALPLGGGLWLLAGGFCCIGNVLFDRLRKIEEKTSKS